MRLTLLAATLLVPLATVAQPASAPDARPGGLSPGEAVGLSVGFTAAAVLGGLAVEHDAPARPVLWALAAAVGPSVGNLAQGEWGDAGIGFGLRAGGAAIMLAAAAGTFWNESDAQVKALVGVGAVGGLVALSGVGYDVVTAGTNAQAHRVRLAPGGAGLALRVGL